MSTAANGPEATTHDPAGTVSEGVGNGRVVNGLTGARLNVKFVPGAMPAPAILQILSIAGRNTKFVKVTSAVLFVAGKVAVRVSKFAVNGDVVAVINETRVCQS